MPGVSLERGKFPLQDYIDPITQEKIFFLHKSGFRIAGHIYNIIYFTTTTSSKLSFEIQGIN